jgi:hypothetical protein
MTALARAQVGDEIVVTGLHIDDPSRKGEIRDILDRGGVEHYRVRWDDGRETIFFPGSNAHVVHLKREK